jgi:hypothetical protein
LGLRKTEDPFLHSSGRIRSVLAGKAGNDNRFSKNFVRFQDLGFEDLRFGSFVQSLILEQEFLEPTLSGLFNKGLSVLQLRA